MSRQDLILLAFGGIQRYIAESHSTADLGNASRIVAELAKRAAEALRAEDDCALVIPSPSTLAGAAGPDASPAEPPNTPSRVVALAPEGRGADYAHAAAKHAREVWRRWIGDLFESAGATPETPGFPDIMWCVAPASAGDYRAQWNLAQTTLAARKRVRTFDFPERTTKPQDGSGDPRGRFGPRPCAVSPRWHSEPDRPAGARDHEKHEELSAAVWLKRLWHANDKLPPKEQQKARKKAPEAKDIPLGFPSTAAVATAPYRAKVLDRWEDETVRDQVETLYDAAHKVMPDEEHHVVEAPVPALKDHEDGGGSDSAELKRWFVRNGGWWVVPETWDAETLVHKHRMRGSDAQRSVADTAAEAKRLERTVAEGRRAAENLAETVDRSPNPYFAILVADLDGLGKHLSEHADQDQHGRVSEQLAQISDIHRSSIRERQGAAVYSGGDDLMAFLPAAEALNAADDCRRAVLEDRDNLASKPEPTSISAAVVFVHQGTPLHLSVERARELLKQAKDVNDKNALAVGYVTGSGTSAQTVRPWTTSHVDDALEALNTFMPHCQGESERQQPVSPRLLHDLRSSYADLAEMARTSGLTETIFEGEVTRLVCRHGGNREQARSLLRLGRSEHDAPSVVPMAAARVAAFLRRWAW
ncbi:hypothetical protein GCM10007147_04600 [Nocardiopsis kunsanensis]|uniref:GGDEF domain-containing protein n=1 Tax=Nocardiopsis kunsanensis TaxID=141693 RepID=A0A919CFQ8_9ACTN|nr:type III-B CRISPR-associated protein Cas10/Cmr2 [Nocardiopsis kunsanensis]GHD16465.1 hypothetical protein GCM10007147_04600 [Nocardiopsis kunsanensis]